ncbi:MAG: Tim44/TimA family putative adaptor protein [Rhodospirillaceae bacterium]|nr:Tim44/TimA family putative adaptor protein [Rhodospirillales bacterium]
MNGDFHFLDIIFFAMVAAFLVLRLRNVLGRRTGNERPPPTQWGTKREAPVPDKPDAVAPDVAADNVVDLASARKPVPADVMLPPGPLGEGAAAIRALDPGFTLEGFLSGARMAFEMIVDAYANGNTKVLRPLLADAVYMPFADAIAHRAQAGETLETELLGIRVVEAVDAHLNGTVAEVTVRFVSEQVNLVKDSEGRIVEGDPQRIVDVVDLWTFSRDTRAKDPNWQLAATRAAEDQKKD